MEGKGIKTTFLVACGYGAEKMWVACSDTSMQEAAGASGGWHPRKEGSSESSSVATVRQDTRDACSVASCRRARRCACTNAVHCSWLMEFRSSVCAPANRGQTQLPPV